MESIKSFIKKEFVLCIAVVCAAITMLIVDWTPKTLKSFIDWKSLAILLSLMLVSEGFKTNGVFEAIGRKLTGRGSIQVVVLSLTMLPLFAAMIITNDVALITFVPLAISALTLANRKDLIIRVVILQTISANLGAMFTPIGDPHNLYVFVKYNPTIMEWVKATLPYLPVAVLIILVPSILKIKKNSSEDSLASVDDLTPDFTAEDRAINAKISSRKIAITDSIYAGLFVLSLLGVFNVVDYPIVVVVVLGVVSAIDHKIPKRVDWGLLVTFIAFFVFSGNLRSIEAVSEFLQRMAGEHTFAVSVVASQVISNVPATIILAPFTDEWAELTIGCDIGAFGTPIASLANLIAIKIYLNSEGANAKKYMLLFTIAEVVVLGILCVFANFVTL